MTSKTALVAFVVAALLAAPRPAGAANKEHQQIMAELRMLQEQQAQLAQALNGLAETLKLITTRIDDQASTSRKAMADQRLTIDNIAETARILRERADDTNVRLSNVGQELQAMRQAIAAIPQGPAPVPGAGIDPATGEPTAPPPAGDNPPPNISPTQYFQRVMGDYAAGQWDLAISGFESFIRWFPTSPQADDAQLLIGNSLYSQGNFEEAVRAYQKVISDYPQGDQLAAAHYKLGQTYENLKQVDLARKAYETAVKSFPTAVEATMARQRLDALNRRR